MRKIAARVKKIFNRCVRKHGGSEALPGAAGARILLDSIDEERIISFEEINCEGKM